MLDVIYILGTLTFFALMWAYVRACAALGTTASAETGRSGGNGQ